MLEAKHVALITGVDGDIGSTLTREVAGPFDAVGMDLPSREAPCDAIDLDLTKDESAQKGRNKPSARQA